MKKGRHHTDEFKREAVKLMMNRSTRTVDEVAKRLGVSPSLLQRWSPQYGEAVAAGCSQESPQASEDVEALRGDFGGNSRLVTCCETPCGVRASASKPGLYGGNLRGQRARGDLG